MSENRKSESNISKEQEIKYPDRLTVNYMKKPCYDICFSNSFDQLAEELKRLNMNEKKICIITDSNVERLYGAEVREKLEGVASQTDLFVFSAGEKSKTLSTVTDIYRFLTAHFYSRNDVLVALGGGVTGDLTGFAAATYLRGMGFVQIPTTLLSQVDSSIGGKTGVDFDDFKNMVGAFYMPSLVYSNISVLKDLEPRQYASGFAEAMKSALIKDASLYEWILDHIYEINDRNHEVMKELVFRTCMIKKNVVEKDPTEAGERALLNFGHTIGHAIEKASRFQLYHGECVALGCVAAAHISYMHNLLSEDEYLEIRDMFVPFQLPISMKHFEPETILEYTKSDKKNSSGLRRFILLKKIGKAFIDTTVTDQEILRAVRELLLIVD